MHQRSIGLDILRAIAILFVFICHGLFMFYDVIDERVGNMLTAYGHFGVNLFFVLSGFLIGKIFIRDFYNNSSYSYNQLFVFWKRRWFRTLPNYFLFFLIYLLIAKFIASDYLHPTDWKPNFFLEEDVSLTSFLVFSHNLFTVNPGFFGQSWSLSVEEWFYILLPFFIIIIAKFSKRRNIKELSLGLAVLLVLLIGWKGFAYLQMPSFFFEIKVIFCLDFILLGVIVASLSEAYPYKIKQLNKTLAIIGCLIFILVNFLYLKFILTSNPTHGYLILINILTCLSGALLIPFFAYLKLKSSFLLKLIEKISLGSYTIYLSHFIFLEFLGNGLLRPLVAHLGPVFQLLAFLVVAFVCFSFSYLHFINFERPIMNLRDKIKLRPSWLRL